jgi:hypothetical protein
LGVAGGLVRRTGRDAIIAGIGSGVAASGKYNAGLIVMVPILALLFRPEARKYLKGDAVALMSAGLLAFAGTSPFVVLDPSSTLAAMQAQFQAYAGGHLGAQGSNNISWYTWTLLSQSWGFGLSALAVPGFVFGLFNRRYRVASLSVLSFCVAYVVLMGLPPTRFDRNLLPVLPCLAWSTGIAVETTMRWLKLRTVSRQGPGTDRIRQLAVVAAILCALLPALLADIRADSVLASQDTRTVAFRLAEEKLPDGARVALEWYTPQLEWTKISSTSFNSLGSHPLAWYKSEGFNYLVVSSNMYGRYFADPAAPASAVQTYQDIFALPLVFEVSADASHFGPTIKTYRLDE